MVARSRRSSAQCGRRAGGGEVGYFTTTTARAWLDATLAEARRGELAGMVRTGASFKGPAEWLRYCEHERAAKPGTLAGYKSIVGVLDAEFGGSAIESFTPDFFERWKGGFATKRKLTNRGVQRYLVALHSIFKRAMKVYGLPRNPLATVERPRVVGHSRQPRNLTHRQPSLVRRPDRIVTLLAQPLPVGVHPADLLA
jgi:hypothetical protein